MIVHNIRQYLGPRLAVYLWTPTNLTYTEAYTLLLMPESANTSWVIGS